MKIYSSVKRRCKSCFIVKRGKVLIVSCMIRKHRQKQG